MSLRSPPFLLATFVSAVLHAAVLLVAMGPLETFHSAKSTRATMAVRVSNAITTPVEIAPTLAPKKKKVVTKSAGQISNPAPLEHQLEPVNTPHTVADADTDYAPAPEYPRMAKLRGLFGVVTLRLGISGLGRPLEATIIASSGHDILDQAALTALKQWRFKAVNQSNELAFWTEKTVEFRLED